MLEIISPDYSETLVHVLEGPGSYGDQVREILLPGSRPIYTRTNAQIIDAVVKENGIGIIPVANSHNGSVGESWKRLEDHRGNGVWIAGSCELAPDHAVVKIKGDIAPIRKIITHHQAYEQCQLRLDELYPEHTFESFRSTIGALEQLKQPGDVAICSAWAIRNIPQLAEKYEIVEEGIGPENNATKFVVIATKERLQQLMALPESEVDIVHAALKDKPGQLLQKFLMIYLLRGNIHEWGQKKVEPGNAQYSLLLITSRLKRDPLARLLMKRFGISLIPHKEDIL